MRLSVFAGALLIAAALYAATVAPRPSVRATGIIRAVNSMTVMPVESFRLPKGTQNVREVVRELVQDRIGASNMPLRLQ